MIVLVTEVGKMHIIDSVSGVKIDYLKCKTANGTIYILHDLSGFCSSSIPKTLYLNLDYRTIGDYAFVGMFFSYAEIHYENETENTIDNWKDRFMAMFTSMVISGANANDFTFAIDWSKEMIIAENLGEIPGALLHEIDILYDKYVTKGGSKCQ